MNQYKNSQHNNQNNDNNQHNETTTTTNRVINTDFDIWFHCNYYDQITAYCVVQGESKKRPSNLKSKYLSNHLSHRNGSVLKMKIWMSLFKIFLRILGFS